MKTFLLMRAKNIDLTEKNNYIEYYNEYTVHLYNWVIAI